MNNQKYSGGWRFGDGGLGLLGKYVPEGYNAGLLQSVGNLEKPKGLLDKAIEQTPVENVLATGSTTGSTRQSSGMPDSNGGLAKNGTNLTDAQWAGVRDKRNEIGPDGKMVGMNNDFDKNSLQAGLYGIVSVLTGNPMSLVSAYPKMAAANQNAMNGLNTSMGAVNSGALGGGNYSAMTSNPFGSTAWSQGVNDTANARLARQGDPGVTTEAAAESGPTLASVLASLGIGGESADSDSVASTSAARLSGGYGGGFGGRGGY